MKNLTHKIQIHVVVSLLSLFLVTHCCRGSKSDSSNIVLIEVSYFKGQIERPEPLPCGGIASIKSNIIKDTVLTDKQELNEIEHQISMIRELKVDSTIYSCDVRIQCKLNLKNGKSIKVCIGKFNCLIKDFKRMTQNDTLVYLIKKYSGYYNYFPKEELMYFEELKQFGLPKDYIDLSRKKSIDSPLLPADRSVQQ